MGKEVMNAIEEQIETSDGEEILLENLAIPKITEDIKKKLESVKTLLSLGFNGCQLAHLDNFPHIPSLVRLEMMGNAIKGSELSHIKHLNSLESLSLSENPIEHFDDLKPLMTFKQLLQLDLSSTPLSKLPNYRTKIFEMFPNLKILDNEDKDGKPYEYSGDGEDEVNGDSEVEGEDNDDDAGSEEEEYEDDDQEDEGDDDDEDEDEESYEDEEESEEEDKKNAKKSKRTKK